LVSNCYSDETNGTISVSSPLDGCGMKSEKGDNSEGGDNSILFSNTLSVIRRVNSFGLIMSNDVTIDVQCSYGTFITDISNAVSVTAPAQTPGTSGFGNFEFSANYFTSESCENNFYISDRIFLVRQN